MNRVLLTGATGFIGGATAAVLRGMPEISLTTLVRGPGRPDLADPRSLAGLCDGVDVLVHAASYVGDDPERCSVVNDAGTEALVGEARRAGVRRIVYASTAAVYGLGPHRGERPDELDCRPVSPRSSSRLAAEGHVLAAGGVVARPHLVYGEGDKWFVPSLIRLRQALGGWLADDSARMSVVHVADLARLLAGLVTADVPPRTVLHANHPEPVEAGTVMSVVSAVHGLGEPERRLTLAEAEAVLNPRHLDLIANDHFYESATIWRLTSLEPGPPFAQAYPAG
ncbi:NAD-dependent epimerase/dehydratase family protein [Amycolatopsis sp. K13G38]|uniref:NAD-dependent epimerase/dehydratase family protein n=1 Tax=Amycolatopsis acididurans TaxID=2724524 RepID=A0ABX1J496_9PSEU|nr:NAD-dependent epimerase/dehydratase family protein [Amycolatopsis acididurans]NKQ54617.1 NAD-dependent epimerase/dehydratase family protein [Amycolatopsis acididurans]